MSSSACTEFLCRLNTMRRDSEMCDVKIVSRGNSDNGDKGCEFMAHMIVLSAASPHFKTMFNSEFKEAVVGEVNLDMDADVVDQLLDYMYTYDLEINESNASRVLPEAAYLQLDDLKKQCHKFIMAHITPTNCLEMWQFARHYSYNDIKRLAWKTAYCNLDELIDLPSFTALCKDDMHLLLSERRLRCHESSVFSGLCNWVHVDATRTGDMAKLLSLVRLTDLGKDFLLDTVGKEPLVADHIDCFRIYHNAVLEFAKAHANPTVSSRVRGDWRVVGDWAGVPLTHSRRPCTAAVLKGKIYSILRDRADVLHEGVWSSVAMPSTQDVEWMTCVVNEVLYAVGANTTIRTVEQYDEMSDVWCIIYSGANQGGELLSATCLDDRIFVAMQGSKTIEALQTKSGAPCFSRVCDLPTGLQKQFTLCALDGDLLVVGGLCDGGRCTDKVQRYDCDNNAWVELAPLSSARSWVAACECDGRLIVAGGYSEDDCSEKSFADVEMLYEGVWSSLPSLKFSRDECGFVALDNTLYAIGGYGASESMEMIRFLH